MATSSSTNNNQDMTTMSSTSSSSFAAAGARQQQAVGSVADDDDDNDNLDAGFLQKILADATNNAYGTIGSEIWLFDGVHLVRHEKAIAVMDKNTTRKSLAAPPSGLRNDRQDKDNNLRATYLQKLVDEDEDDYITPPSYAPGVGFPGILFQEAHGGGGGGGRGAGGGSTIININTNDNVGAGRIESRKNRRNKKKNKGRLQNKSTAAVIWRQVDSIVQDPDQQMTARMSAIANAGVGYVAGVPFNVDGVRGIVIFWARDDANLKLLQKPENEKYLVAAAHVMGATCALQGPRQAIVEKRQKRLQDNFEKVRRKMGHVLKQSTIEDLVTKPVATGYNKMTSFGISAATTSTASSGATEGCLKRGTSNQVCSYVQQKMHQQVRKAQGAGMPLPPMASTQEALFTFVGVLLTAAALGGFNRFMSTTYGKDWEIVNGPFGALLTLQFALVPAPAAQPRNAILGNLIAISLALCVAYIPDEIFPVYMQQALATAASIGLMHRLGIVHPPAGAAALLFAGGQYKWSNMLMMLVSDFIAIGMAVIINNFNSLRQYPTYWGFRHTKGQLASLFPKRKHKTDDDDDDIELKKKSASLASNQLEV